MRVRNIGGTSRYSSPTDSCATWLEHWEKERKIVATSCCCCKKVVSHSQLVGGHVKKVDSYDDSYYIVAMCQKCNNQSTSVIFDVNPNDLVPVTKKHN